MAYWYFGAVIELHELPVGLHRIHVVELDVYIYQDRNRFLHHDAIAH